MLFIPDILKIELRDKSDRPLKRSDILLGIRTRATHKNDINISPLTSNDSGIIEVTADDIRRISDKFISGGLMDYSSLESAKPEIEIYYIGTISINKWASYLQETVDIWPDNKQQFVSENPNASKRLLPDLEKEIENTKLEIKFLTKSFNAKSSTQDDITLFRDIWNSPSKKKEVLIKLDFIYTASY
jgi:hypothetical protein